MYNDRNEINNRSTRSSDTSYDRVEELRLGRRDTSAIQTPPVDWISQMQPLLDFLNRIMGVGIKPTGLGTGGAGGTSVDIFSSLPGMLRDAVSGITLPAQQVTSVINQALNVRATSTTILTIDGRMLATVIKPYLLADLQRATTTTTVPATVAYG
jgi:hypothetical protein